MPYEIFTELAGRIRNTGIRLNLDLGNLMACGIEPLPVLDEMYNRIETIHASDIAEKGSFKPVEIGKGVVPYPEIFRYLNQKGFDKWICIEEASFRGFEGVKNAVEYIKIVCKKELR
jgi:sugar phosphate isomerase/epimerase